MNLETLKRCLILFITVYIAMRALLWIAPALTSILGFLLKIIFYVTIFFLVIFVYEYHLQKHKDE